MAKQAVIEQDGVIVESLSNAMFRVELEIGQKIICNISGTKLLPKENSIPEFKSCLAVRRFPLKP